MKTTMTMTRRRALVIFFFFFTISPMTYYLQFFVSHNGDLDARLVLALLFLWDFLFSLENLLF